MLNMRVYGWKEKNTKKSLICLMVRSPRFFFFLKKMILLSGQLKEFKPVFHDEAMAKRSRFTFAYVTTTVMLNDQQSHSEILYREFTMFHQNIERIADSARQPRGFFDCDLRSSKTDFIYIQSPLLMEHTVPIT